MRKFPEDCVLGDILSEAKTDGQIGDMARRPNECSATDEGSSRLAMMREFDGVPGSIVTGRELFGVEVPKKE